VAPGTFLPELVKLSEAHAGSAMFQEAVVNSLNGREDKFKAALPKSSVTDTTHVINEMLAEVSKNKREKKINSIFDKESRRHDPRTAGLLIFRSTCAACHGAGGEGIENVAPPLNGSEYVEGPSERLAMILLNGLEGPIHIKGQLYHFNGSMPNFGNNFNEQQIADVIQYLHNSFVANPPKSIKAEKIKKLKASHTGTLTEADLLKMPVSKE
jgi:mono/diheme cytochrome c family protein